MALESVTIRHSAPAAARFPGLAIVSVVGRRALRGALIWGGVFALLTWILVSQFHKEYPTAAARARLVKTMADNVGWQALFGPTHNLDTVAGYTAAHLIGIGGLIVAVWGLLAGTRLLRGEEDAGRWEPLLAGQTTRGRAAAGALAGLGGALLALWAVTAAALVGFGRTASPAFPVGASLFAAVAAVATAAIFLAVGAFASQLAATRHQAAMLAATIFGAAYLLRLIAYSGSSLRSLRWASPLSWVDELRPLTGSQPLLLLPIAGVVALLVALTIVLAGRRDLGASVLPSRESAAARTRHLNGPLGLAWRLDRGRAVGWIAGLATGGLLFGSLTKTSEDVWRNQSGGVIGRLGGASGGAAYLGITFLIVALLVTLAAASQVAATREEEADGYLDHLLARPLSRLPWLAGRFAISAATLVTMGILTGLAAWAGAASAGAHVSFSSLLAAGVNVIPAGIFVLGAGTLVHGLVPRLAAPAAYGLVAWSFLVEIVGANIGAAGWLLNLSVLHHLARAPAVDPRWGSATVLAALGIAAAIAGALTFAHRDLKSA